VRESLAERLAGRVQAALRRARASGEGVLVSATAAGTAALDPVAAAAGSRREGEPWFCLEQPDRSGYAVAGLGCALALEARGPGRFDELAARWRQVAARAAADAPEGVPAGGGLVALGGFAFAPDGGEGPQWTGFPAASMLVPELSLARGAGAASVTFNVHVQPDDTREQVLDRCRKRLGELTVAPLPLLDPAPVGDYRVHSPIPPVHYEHAVAAAVERIGAGEIEKIVLCREVEVNAPVAYDPAALLGLLRAVFGSCCVFAVGRGEATFLGASPELLVRRDGQRASTVALAGSIGRSADPAVDDHLGERLLRSAKDREENAIVVRRIVRALRPHALWVAASPEPALVRVANVQHLATPIRAQLAGDLSAIELAGVLHPTPAVGGEPRERAAALIPALEGVQRGWYAGPIGWTDAAGDGEFCVALRCALVRGSRARLYAGCGIVRDSDPAAELAETELKLAALLPALAW
jgi:isochorismate synthase